MKIERNFLVKSWYTSILCFHFQKKAMAGTLLCARFENESQVGAGWGTSWETTPCVSPPSGKIGRGDVCESPSSIMFRYTFA